MKKSFSHRFISNPRLAWVIAIVISLCGTLCLSRMPVFEYPNIIPVTITVKAMYTGATAEVVNESVGMVLEDQINAVDDVWYFKSTSNAKGNYSCNVMFRPGVNPDIALVNVQNAVKRAEKKLPADASAIESALLKAAHAGRWHDAEVEVGGDGILVSYRDEEKSSGSHENCGKSTDRI